MKDLRHTLAGAALAGMLVVSGFSAPAFAGGDNGHDKGGHSHHDEDERKNGEVDVVVKYYHHGEWKVREYNDVELKKAASMAKEKADGGDWHKYYRDAKYSDRTDKTVKTVDKKGLKVLFKQDDDDARKNGEVDVIVKYRHHGEWESKRYYDVELKEAASIAKDKADGGDWHKYYRDARYTDKTDKTVKTVDKKWVKVLFEQDDD
ncbi:hypothetical protein [Kocuria turfanensis]|uniref:Uncharacterized protein n=1 Tax=Kocuria turfanensis TaxID=388357 RepID=A0A512IDC2_9MICC|nr:hypothetical protein [Kocuria turfanensis]GEO95691.1 hypothetical protein KTU01_18140 [Kocuria turfanensis]